MSTTRIRTNADRNNRIYIAGPMTGLPDLNFPAFNTCAANLRAQGWQVENPAEHGIQEGATWSDYLRHDFAQLASCQAIYLLPGWQNSKGALLELHIAQALGDMLILGDIEDIDTNPKPFMYGIQEPDGSPYMEKGCVAPTTVDLQPEVDGINSQQDPEDGLYRIVPLYTHPAPITPQVAALQEAEAALEVAIARMTKDAPNYPVHITSEGKALLAVCKALTGALPNATLELLNEPIGQLHNWYTEDGQELQHQQFISLEYPDQTQLGCWNNRMPDSWKLVYGPEALLKAGCLPCGYVICKPGNCSQTCRPIESAQQSANA